MEVRALVSGEVFAMTVFAPKEVVRPGESIMQIVPDMPDDAGLVVTARLNTIDVDQVYLGQPAVLRFLAFLSRETSEFDGHVVWISPGAVHGPESGLSWNAVSRHASRSNDTGRTVPALKTATPTLHPSDFTQIIEYFAATIAISCSGFSRVDDTLL